MFSYTHKPPASSVSVAIICPSVERSDILQDALASSAMRFGFIPQFNHTHSTVRFDSSAELRHIIVVADVPFDTSIIESTFDCVHSHNASASIAFAYSSGEHMISYESSVNAAKRHCGDRLNFLRPDEEHDRGIRVSTQKIIENAVCDSVRVKYQPQRLSDNVSGMISRSEREFFVDCSRYYREKVLFHRSETDGYFAARVKDGFAITATKTKKTDLDFERISVVHEYDQSSETISYSGRYLPSSDAVEAAIIFRSITRMAAVIHTHASARFTRNPAYRRRVVVPRLPYGEAPLGLALVSGLSSCLAEDQFVIMDDHGEVFGGMGEAAAAIRLLERYCGALDGS